MSCCEYEKKWLNKCLNTVLGCFVCYRFFFTEVFYQLQDVCLYHATNMSIKCSLTGEHPWLDSGKKRKFAAYRRPSDDTVWAGLHVMPAIWHHLLSHHRHS